MPLPLIIRNDITHMEVDAIVNAANASLLGGGGVDGAIHAAAGPELLEACRALGGCRVGQAKLTEAYRLPCRYVIHTVGPRWRGGMLGERRQLASCYREALALAAEHSCETVAFPLISAGTYGYPKDKAMKVALDTIGDFLEQHDMTVFLVLFGQESTALGRSSMQISRSISTSTMSASIAPSKTAGRGTRLAESAAFDGDVWESVALRPPKESGPASRPGDTLTFSRPAESAAVEEAEDGAAAPAALGPTAGPGLPKPKAAPGPPVQYAAARQDSIALERLLDELDESFQQMLLRKIDESGMTDAQCYKKANIDRKLFSKIRNDIQYKPKKTTAIAFAVALELDMDETEELLRKAGYALSNSRKFDVIIAYFIEHRKYNIYEINETLFYYDQSLLGA